jgi:hypothetical protein
MGVRWTEEWRGAIEKVGVGEGTEKAEARGSRKNGRKR